MVALDANILADIERDEIQAELDECRRLRTLYRANLRRLRDEGKLTVAWEAKFQTQIEALSRHILRFEGMLA